jgi:hypothetical protein
MAGRVSVASETNSAALSAQAIVTPKAECGPDALPENLKCQLDVCCGQVNFRMAGCDTGSIGRSLGSVEPQVRVVDISFKNRVDVFLAADFAGMDASRDALQCLFLRAVRKYSVSARYVSEQDLS